MNTKGADQTVRVRNLVCAFVVRMQKKIESTPTEFPRGNSVGYSHFFGYVGLASTVTHQKYQEYQAYPKIKLKF